MDDGGPGGGPGKSFDAAPFYRWMTAVTLALVLFQASLAGRGWFVDFDLIDIHGWVGNVTFIAVVVQLGLAIAARGVLGNAAVTLSGALLVLVVVQIALGYSGRESGEAAAWHIPNGVLIFGIASAAVTLAFTDRLSRTV